MEANLSARPRYIIDPEVSRFTVQAFAGGMLSALGHNPKFVARDFTGEVSFDLDAPEEASLRMTMPAASLTLVDDVSDSDRRTIERTMHEQVLEDSRFPEIISGGYSRRWKLFFVIVKGVSYMDNGQEYRIF